MLPVMITIYQVKVTVHVMIVKLGGGALGLLSAGDCFLLCPKKFQSLSIYSSLAPNECPNSSCDYNHPGKGGGGGYRGTFQYKSCDCSQAFYGKK